ncbi:MAG: DUF2335 domain-containing protein [Comamonas sp.]
METPPKRQSVPPENAEQARQQQAAVVQSQQWEGPLPPPGALQQFNAIIPDGANRIMAMVEAEQAHRIKTDQEVLAATVKDTRRGHWIGLTISLCALIGAGVTAYLGAHPVVSVAMVGLPIAVIIQAIVASKSHK